MSIDSPIAAMFWIGYVVGSIATLLGMVCVLVGGYLVHYLKWRKSL